jgi:hypothetical protein
MGVSIGLSLWCVFTVFVCNQFGMNGAKLYAGVSSILNVATETEKLFVRLAPDFRVLLQYW